MCLVFIFALYFFNVCVINLNCLMYNSGLYIIHIKMTIKIVPITHYSCYCVIPAFIIIFELNVTKMKFFNTFSLGSFVKYEQITKREIICSTRRN